MAKITDIRDKKPKKPITAEEAAERAYRKHFRKTPVEDEPEGLASGKADANGKMSMEDDEDEK